MIVDPQPGVIRDQVLAAVREIAAELMGARSGAAGREIHAAYVEWANRSALRLAKLVTQSHVDRLVLTPRYWQLQLMYVSGSSPAVMTFLNVELDERAREFEETERALVAQIARWSRAGVFVIPDTSFYIRHHEKLADVDWHPLLKIWHDEVHVLVPIAVVDELDRLKETKDRHVRWRAGHTLGVLDERLRDPNQPARLRAEDFTALDNNTGEIPSGEVTIEIVFDPPGHVRLPITDDEIIDRALSARVYAGRPITIVTYDTGQSMRARRAGLQAVKLEVPREETEPARS